MSSANSSETHASLALKILLILTMAVVTLGFGLLPIPVLRLLRKKSNERRSPTPTSSEEQSDDPLDFAGSKWPSLTLCLLTCFSGGVFLATCFLDLLPGVIEKLEYIKVTTNWHLDYPLAELVVCSGFFLVFFLEEVVVLFYGGHGHSHGIMEADSPGPGVVHVHDHKQRNEASPVVMNGSTATPTGRQNGSKKRSSAALIRDKSGHYPLLVEEDEEDSSKSGKSNSSSSLKKNQKVPALTIVDDTGNGETVLDNTPDVAITSKKNGAVKKSPGRRSGKSGARSPIDKVNLTHRRSGCTSGAMSLHSDCSVFTNVDLAEPERCEGPCDTDEDPPILMTSRPHAHSHGVRSLTLLLALSFHSVIEGMAFGIQESRDGLIVLFTSLIIHKVVVAFAVGLQLARTHAHQIKLVFVSILILAMVTPIGAAIGISVSEASIDSGSKDMTLMVFEGLAAGTFLYVTFFEILIHERDNEHPNLLKLFVLIIGFGLMAGLQTMEHDHGIETGTTVAPLISNSTESIKHLHDHDHDHIH